MSQWCTVALWYTAVALCTAAQLCTEVPQYTVGQHSAALLVRHPGHNVAALLLSVGGALLLGHFMVDGGALLYRGCGTFFLEFCSEVCDSSCVADWLSHSGACL